MLRAIVSSDTRFYEHHGVDPRGVLQAFIANHSGDVSRALRR
jgi:membrane peptidoglycan carboxypeptidase